VTDYYEYGNAHFSSFEGGNILDQLSDYQILKKFYPLRYNTLIAPEITLVNAICTELL
jgi:hypothetical protein